MSEENIRAKLDLHKKWMDTFGNEGERLVLEDIDLKMLNVSDTSLVEAYLISCDCSGLYLENVDICAASFAETLLNGVKLKSIKGIKEAFFESINIGTVEQPHILFHDEARQWLRDQQE